MWGEERKAETEREASKKKRSDRDRRA